MTSALETAYAARLSAGQLRPDPAQAAGLASLARLEAELAAARPSGLSGLFRRRPKAAKGVYLWGPVGRGKSMLMDLFFESAPIAKKRRIHFHVFMAEVHAGIDAWRKGDAAARKARFGQSKGDDPIAPTAELIAENARLLCFDEFQVTDIADAMILGRLFEQLFVLGVTLVVTSNRPPDDLYRDGINRQLFLPFIAMLCEKMQVMELESPNDYRQHRLAGVFRRPQVRWQQHGSRRQHRAEPSATRHCRTSFSLSGLTPAMPWESPETDTVSLKSRLSGMASTPSSTITVASASSLANHSASTPRSGV